MSCIIPLYNAAAWLERAVRSLLDCGLSDLEIVMVDDGSTDESLAEAHRLQRVHEGIRVLQHPDKQNHGVSATRNLGIENSIGELICFLDGDDFVYPHRFEAAHAVLQSDVGIDGVYGTTKMVFESEEAQAGWYQGEDIFGFQDEIRSEELLGRLLKGKCWATSAILFRRELLERTGLFDPTLHIAEDCNLWFRMAAVGTLVGADLTNPVSAYWRTTGSAYQAGASQKVHMLRSMQLFQRWLNSRQVDPTVKEQARQCIRDFAINGIIAARSSQQRGLAWSLAAKSIQLFPSIGLDYRFQRQLLSMTLGR
ncbi:MAG: glycosyltransferase [Planctomycetaceae bacterium]|nr:glycosyltransferase [Planctomycetaceae bacterium]MCB9952032.1 glycosyltransferase [Planctomycetaceae bacterium]